MRYCACTIPGRETPKRPWRRSLRPWTRSSWSSRTRSKREGLLGWLRCGMDAVSRSVPPLVPAKPQHPLSDYRLVLIGTPVWAGRCSSVVRAFLKESGTDLRRVGYVLTRGGSAKHSEVYRQMDGYVLLSPPVRRVAAKRLCRLPLLAGAVRQDGPGLAGGGKQHEGEDGCWKS